MQKRVFLCVTPGMITIIPCDCHCKYGHQGYDWNTCINFGKGLNSNPDRGLGRIVTEEEALEILRKADDVGLVHSGEAEVICNCNVKYCYPMLASLQLDLVHQWPVTDYVIDFDESKCLKCGLCTKRCQFGVFKLENKVLTLDKSKCWGCGICETKCPGKALKTVKIGE